MLRLRKPVMLTAILFDLDNTLIDRDAAFHDCVFEHVHDVVAQRELIDMDAGGHGDREKLFSTWQKHAGTVMTQQLLGRLIAEQIRPDPGLLDALEKLSQMVDLGIISNGGGETQRRKIEAAGLGKIISPARIWISGEVGMAKPEPGIFQLAIRALHEQSMNCLYIGDQADDFKGAIDAGMQACTVSQVLNAERLATLLKGWLKPRELNQTADVAEK